MRSARALRSQIFEPGLFGDPAWDILLDLYVCDMRQVRTKVSTVGVDSGIAGSTALRWLNVLEVKGLVERRPDPSDGRRVFVSLSLTAIAAMNSLFAVLDAAG